MTTTTDLETVELRPLKIGEAASRAGVNFQTLRYYERRGLLDPVHRHTGHREYDADAVTLVRTIKAAQRLGLTLAEIEELLELTGGRAAGSGAITDRAREKIAEIEMKTEQLSATKELLQTLVDLECDSLVRCGCPLLCPIAMPWIEEEAS